jgi:hypothetical protein
MGVWLFYNQHALVFPMDLQHCHIQDLSSCNSFFTQPNKLLVSHVYIYSHDTFTMASQRILNLCILIVASHLSKHERKHHCLPKHHFNIPNFSKCNSTLSEFNPMCQYPWPHSHTMHPCINFSFMLGIVAMVCWNSTNLSHMGSLSIFIITTGLSLPL